MGEPLPKPDAVASFIEETLERLVNSPPQRGVATPPEEAKPFLDDLLTKTDTYRDGMLTLLAFPVVAGRPIDLTGPKLRGARSVAQRVASTLPRLKIAGRRDALQTIAKGAPTYMGRERGAWNSLLAWASPPNERSVEELAAAFEYLASGIASTARDLPPMPELNVPRLTFARAFGLLDELLGTPSKGAHEQFCFASLLEAYLLQTGASGYIEVRNLNASDASTGAAADVQYKHGNHVSEAYEVTADDWRSKLQAASEVLATRDLARVHILSAQAQIDTGDMIASLVPDDLDVSVLDVREEVRSLLARLDKFHRAEALKRLYGHLVERQSNDALVARYVEALDKRGLT
jgi:hypothetical protein